ncbi:MAG: DsbA family protein [Archaeoglobales archaeon]|nr:DsbA family protein [Archaeoglobales archaeon]
MKSEKIVTIGVAITTLLLGFLIGYYVPKMLKISEELDQKFVEDRINEIIGVQGYKAKIINYNESGKAYNVTLEFQYSGMTLGTQSYYIIANKYLIPNDPSCVLALVSKQVNVSEDDDPYIGAEKPKVTIIEFSDYACPYCAKFALEVEKKIVEEYGSVVKLVFRDFPVHGNASYKAAEAANCAKEQNKFWEYHYLLFERQDEWYGNLSKLYDYASELGLNYVEFKNCLDSGKYRSEVEKDLSDGVSYGVSGTPTFFVNGKMFVGYKSYEDFKQIIESMIKT